MRTARRRTAGTPWLGRRAARFGIAVGLLGALLSGVPWVLEIDEAVGLAALFRFRGPVDPPGDVVVISVSRDAAAAVGQGSELDEWRRAVHADLIEAATAAGAAVVVFDIIFDRPREPAEDDLRLAAAIEAAGNVILAERVELLDPPSAAGASAALRDARVRPLPAFARGALGTAPFTLPTVPYRVSQLWLFGRGEPDLPSLPAVALQAHWLEHYDALVGLVRAARPDAALEIPPTSADLRERGQLQAAMQALRRVFRADPVLARDVARLAGRAGGPMSPELEHLIGLYSGGDSRYVNYYGPARTIRTVPYDQALNRAAELGLAGKTLFVGYSEHRQPEQQDSFNSVFSERSGHELGGVEIGATAFANLLEGRSLVALAMPAHLLLVLAFGVLAGAALSALRARAATIAAVFAGAGYFALVYALFDAGGVWLPLAVPLGVQLPVALALTVLARYADSDRQRVRVQTVLGYYVPESVVKRLAEQSVSMEASRQLVHGTCLFTDVEQYTTVSESLHPEELRALMNDYYEVMFDVVTEHGGYVSDTSGDSMAAVWTTAVPDPASRARACAAALGIIEAVGAFNRNRRQQLPTRVGLESGELVLGNIGAAQRFEYRAIGDIVNTASRLQGLNRLLGTRVLISGATLEGTGMAARDLGTFLLRGKTQPVRVYEPVAARNGDLSEPLLEEFRAALACFERCAWREARARFAALAGVAPDDGPTAYYGKLAAALERAPPADWPGFITVDVK